MSDLLLAHIRTRLQRRGYNPDLANIDFLRIKVNASQISLPLYNKFIYLNSKQVPASLLIESDTFNFTSEDAVAYNNFNEYRHIEFSGNVIISVGGATASEAGVIDLEFILVEPNVEIKKERYQ